MPHIQTGNRRTGKKKTKLIFQRHIASLVERHFIPLSLLMDFDQTRVKYVFVANQTLSRKGSNLVAIKDLSFKKSITASFRITFNLKFVSMQLIYGGKSQRTLPRVNFPDSFSLNAKEKHFSNT